jgi:hypothetical protein
MHHEMGLHCFALRGMKNADDGAELANWKANWEEKHYWRAFVVGEIA